MGSWRRPERFGSGLRGAITDPLRFARAVPVQCGDLPARPTRAQYGEHDEKALRVEAVLHEYDAVKQEIQTALSSQVSILSFGAATVGLLVTGGAQVWTDAPVVSAVLFLIASPLVCFLTLVVYAGEQVRLMRAGLFVRVCEEHVSEVLGLPAGELLTWEQWDIRDGKRDVERQARIAVQLVFVVLAAIFVGAGFYRMWSDGKHVWASLLLCFSVLTGVVCLAWLRGRFASAMAFRRAYPTRPGRV